jgi:hypothetical protein
METQFLTFDELPHDDDIDLRFYHSSNGSYYSPRRHWCLLAEILSVETFLRLRLMVRDKDGVEFQIALHTDDRGSEVPSNLLVPGYTVAILYAHQHGFLDFTAGIRQEEKQTLRVCARTYKRPSMVVKSNKILQIFGTNLETFCRLQRAIEAKQYTDSVCHGCGSTTTAKLRCAKCTSTAYCNKVRCTIVSLSTHR